MIAAQTTAPPPSASSIPHFQTSRFINTVDTLNKHQEFLPTVTCNILSLSCGAHSPGAPFFLTLLFRYFQKSRRMEIPSYLQRVAQDAGISDLTSFELAEALEDADPLKHLRDEFFYPKMKTLPHG